MSPFVRRGDIINEDWHFFTRATKPICNFVVKTENQIETVREVVIVIVFTFWFIHLCKFESTL